jgi:hypothetical protein
VDARELRRLGRRGRPGADGVEHERFRLQHQLAARPSAVSSRQPTVGPGDVAPNFTVEGTDGSRVMLREFRGKRVLLRLTRAVSAGII